MESPEHERRSVVEYVEGQCRGEETVHHAEKISSERVMGTEYDVWDVETDKNQWWVITNLTNLYLQDDYKSLDYLLSFHIGLMHRIFANDARTAPASDEEKERLLIPWRKWEQAGKAAEKADEAEEFQAVGMRCREALLSFIRSAAKDEMVPEGAEVPKQADFLHWSEYIAAAITPTSLGSAATSESRPRTPGILFSGSRTRPTRHGSMRRSPSTRPATYSTFTGWRSYGMSAGSRNGARGAARTGLPAITAPTWTPT